MMEFMLKAKIHMATVTEKEIEYEGSIGIDEELLELAGIKINEMVLVSDVNNGNRLVTYVIPEHVVQENFIKWCRRKTC